MSEAGQAYAEGKFSIDSVSSILIGLCPPCLVHLSPSGIEEKLIIFRLAFPWPVKVYPRTENGQRRFVAFELLNGTAW